VLRSDAKPSVMCPRGYPCEAMKDQSVRPQCRWLHVATEAEPPSVCCCGLSDRPSALRSHRRPTSFPGHGRHVAPRAGSFTA
jgi:hypothetical protein